MTKRHDYRLGDHIRLTCPYVSSALGEQARIIHIRRDERGNVLALDLLFSELSERAGSTTVYPHEVEPVATDGDSCLV